MPEEMGKLTEADSAKLEKLVAKIQTELAPDAEVIHNVKLPGRKSGRPRQIDVLINQAVGQYKIQIVIDCKDYSAPVDVKGVEEFWGMVDDVGAQKGVLVCPKGFTKSAKARAQGLQIDLYSPVDTDPHKWQARVTMPAICDFRGAGMAFSVSTTAPYPFMISHDFFNSTEVYNSDGKLLGTCISVATDKWNQGDWPVEVGEHDAVNIFTDSEVFVDNGYGMRLPVELTVKIIVEQQLYYGQYPIKRLSGFKDEITGGLITNAFQIGLLDFEEVQNKWRKIKNEEDAPVPPVIRLTGLVGWQD